MYLLFWIWYIQLYRESNQKSLKLNSPLRKKLVREKSGRVIITYAYTHDGFTKINIEYSNTSQAGISQKDIVSAFLTLQIIFYILR